MTQRRWKKRAETCAVSNRRNNARILVTLRSLSLSVDVKRTMGSLRCLIHLTGVFLFLQTSLGIESLPGFGTAVSQIQGVSHFIFICREMDVLFQNHGKASDLFGANKWEMYCTLKCK
ncbi:hypothetical protein CDAR_182331 [Caerostris darwini]|uniref:Uncharacterized protein n=1 Tax=Caerostris darwini TaxID=1538125 RepID=A0AAV4U5K2_9ARAC|nr:hypothetical protein CDAR_182331 [Caerostris darwini]